jgi:thioredoxin-like negative regulator of GroEL
MTSLGFTALVQVIVAASGGETYADAHRETMETGRPLVVVVGADWCPACKVLNTTVIPQVRQRGLLRKVAFAVVNYDREQQLAAQLTENGPIPQILTYRRTADGWRMRRLIGAQSVDTVETFITEAIRLQETAAPTQPAKNDDSVAGKPQRSPGHG